MTLCELGFILLILGSVISLLLSVFMRRSGGARRILVTLVSVWGVYLVILAVTGVLRPQKVFRIGEEQCFDEMCFAVVDAQTIPEQAFNPSAAFASRLYIVKVRVTNRSRGRAQAERGLRGRLYDGSSYIDVSEAAQRAYDAQHGESPKLTQKIVPGESILCVLVFDVQHEITQHPALTLNHGFTPGYFVIGESPLLHKPDIHPLPEGREKRT